MTPGRKVGIWEHATTTEGRCIREIDLGREERVDHLFVPEEGLVDQTPAKGPLLVLTSQRVISFNQVDGHQETTLMPLADLKGSTIKKEGRSLNSLMQGLFLMLVGVLAYFFVGLFVVTSGSIIIPVAVGAAIIFAGVLSTTRYFFWEPEGAITFIAFRGDTWEINFPYRGTKAVEDSSRVVNSFFRLKDEPDGHGKDNFPIEGYSFSHEEDPYTPFT